MSKIPEFYWLISNVNNSNSEKDLNEKMFLFGGFPN